MRHMGANFYKPFNSKHLMELFKRLCAQNQQKKFNELWDRLQELTTKHSNDQQARGPTIGGEEPESLCALPTDGPQTRRRPSSSIKIFAEWIANEPKQKWCLLYDEGGVRFGIMTTNLAEV